MFGGHSSPSSALKASTASSALVAFTPSPTAINTSSASALPLAQLTRAPSNAYSSTWTFTQGFLLGQASFLILCGVFIRYVVFEDAEKSRARRLEREKKAVMSTTNVPPPSSNELLDKAGYDMSTHPSETSDWINVLFAQASFQSHCEKSPILISCSRFCKDIEMTCLEQEVKKVLGNRWKSG